jgi:hypothetical protein
VANYLRGFLIKDFMSQDSLIEVYGKIIKPFEIQGKGLFRIGL